MRKMKKKPKGSKKADENIRKSDLEEEQKSQPTERKQEQQKNNIEKEEHKDEKQKETKPDPEPKNEGKLVVQGNGQRDNKGDREIDSREEEEAYINSELPEFEDNEDRDYEDKIESHESEEYPEVDKELSAEESENGLKEVEEEGDDEEDNYEGEIDYDEFTIPRPLRAGTVAQRKTNTKKSGKRKRSHDEADDVYVAELLPVPAARNKGSVNPTGHSDSDIETDSPAVPAGVVYPLKKRLKLDTDSPSKKPT